MSTSGSGTGTPASGSNPLASVVLARARQMTSDTVNTQDDPYRISDAQHLTWLNSALDELRGERAGLQLNAAGDALVDWDRIAATTDALPVGYDHTEALAHYLAARYFESHNPEMANREAAAFHQAFWDRHLGRKA